jgi:hypothetical protein
MNILGIIAFLASSIASTPLSNSEWIMTGNKLITGKYKGTEYSFYVATSGSYSMSTSESLGKHVWGDATTSSPPWSSLYATLSDQIVPASVTRLAYITGGQSVAYWMTADSDWGWQKFVVMPSQSEEQERSRFWVYDAGATLDFRVDGDQ